MRRAQTTDQVEPPGKTVLKKPAKPINVAVLANLTGAKHRDVVRGILHTAQGAAYGWRIAAWDATPAGLAAALAWGAQALAVQVMDDRVCQAVLSCGLPAINISSVDQPLPCVRVDDDAVGRIAAQHLYAQGATTAVMVGPRSSFAERRFAAFTGSLQKLGVTEPILWLSISQVRQHARRWTKRGVPVGVFACTVDAGYEVAQQCRGVCAIPDCARVIVAGDDDIFCAYADPPLTSIPLSGEQCGAAVVEILARCLRYRRQALASRFIQPQPLRQRRSTEVPIAHPMIAQALAWMDAHRADLVGVADVAAHVQVSRRSLENYFRCELGQGVHAVFRARRLAHAQQLLQQTDDAIRHIANQCGFATAEHFTTVFTEFAGLPPGRWRQQVRRPGNDSA